MVYGVREIYDLEALLSSWAVISSKFLWVGNIQEGYNVKWYNPQKFKNSTSKIHHTNNNLLHHIVYVLF